MSDRGSKGDRALELREKGLDTQAIAERLGVRPGLVKRMVHAARVRREKQAEVRA
jgi:hypothetical protein